MDTGTLFALWATAVIFQPFFFALNMIYSPGAKRPWWLLRLISHLVVVGVDIRMLKVLSTTPANLNFDWIFLVAVALSALNLAAEIYFWRRLAENGGQA